MKGNKMLSGVLALSMIVSNAPLMNGMARTAHAAGEEQVLQATNLAEGYTDPWNRSDIPALEAKAGVDVDAIKFTHEEWTGNEYVNPAGETMRAVDVYGINREEASMFASTSVVYDTVDKAITGAKDYRKDASKYVQFLTGEKQADWSLVVLQNQTLAQGDAYKNFYKTDYTASTKDWKSNLQLPCSWTRQGFDFSIYTNSLMPWQTKYDSDVQAPKVPTNYNPVGLYRKSFVVNDDMRAADGRIYISFQGVESSYYVYVNGKEVGYSEDSYSPHSFDITDYLNEGDEENLLAVEVHKFCEGTWFEDQDMFYDGGIFRDIYLYSAPLVHIQDYKVVTDLDENYENATLDLEVTVANASAQEVSGYKVDAKLYDAEGNVFVNGMELDPGTIAAASETGDGKGTAFAEKTVLAPELWSAETPYLYTLVLSLYDSATDAYLGSVSQQLGFREIEFVSTEVDENGKRTTTDKEYKPITINGKRLLLKGTDRHDTDPVYGKHVPEETQEEDVRLMKQYNLNAIRTSHYSNDEYLYYLCDKFGVYVMAETNFECHWLRDRRDPNVLRQFYNLASDRTETTFKRLRNRSSVVIWSPANESYRGDMGSKNFADGIFYDQVWYFKDNDPTRPVHCECAGNNYGVDMGSNMYPSVSVVQSRAKENMPYVVCEYAHAMGNAVGNLKEYWDAIRSHDNMMGAFIWDWVDQSRLLDLPVVYKLTDSAQGVKGSANIKNINEEPGEGSLSSKSLEGYAAFNDGDHYNKALTGADQSFTLEAICKPTSDKADKVIFSKGDRSMALKTNGQGELEFFVYNNGWKAVTVEKPENWMDGKWHQLAVSYDKGNVKIYWDGSMLEEGTIDNNIASTSFDLGIGYCLDKKRDFDGEFSMARVYRGALTAEQLQAQYSTEPVITADDENVILWADYGNIVEDEEHAAYDYYAEASSHQNLYRDETSGKFFCYGGDNGESPNDGSFCVNGLVSPDRDVQPELYQVKYIYQSVWFTAEEKSLAINGKVDVYNENNFVNLNDFDVVWTLTEDGETIGSGTLTPEETDITGGERGTLYVPYWTSMPEQKKDGAEYYLKLSVQLKEDTPWAKAGHEVAYEQFQIPVNVEQAAKSISTDVTVNEDEEAIAVSGKDFSFTVNKTTGQLENYLYKGEQLLVTGPVPNYWRAPLNNDKGYDANWRNVNKGVTASDISVDTNEDGQTTIAVTLASASKSSLKQTMVYTVDGSGAVTVDATVDGRGTGLGRYLRIGTVMELPEGYENVEWYGNGPVESMLDRKQFATVGRYETTVSEMFYPFLDTQDTGSVTDVKWFTVTNPDAENALAIAAQDTMECSAMHFTADDLTDARHPYELTKLDTTVLSVNYGSQGTGNGSCGPGLLSQYEIPNNKEYSYRYTVVPYTVAENDAMDVTRAYRTVASKNIIQEAAEELIAKIDSVIVTDSSTEELEELMATYKALPQEAKDIVTEERYEKLEEAVGLAGQFNGGEASVTVQDKGKHHFDMDITADETAGLGAKDGIAAFHGQTVVKGEGADEAFGNVIGGTKPFTIEADINPNNGKNMNMIASKGDSCAAIRVGGTSIEAFIKNTSGQWVTVSVPLSAEQYHSWIHVAMVYDGSSITGYVEGETPVSKSAGAVAASSYPFGIGYCPETNRMSINYIQNIRLYSKALTTEELDGRAYEPTDESVELWYDFDEYEYNNIDRTPAGVRLNLDALTMEESGQTASLQAALAPYYAEGELVYSSADENVATVDAEGVVTAVKSGETTVRAAVKGNESIYAEIPVTVDIPAEEDMVAVSLRTLCDAWAGEDLSMYTKESADALQAALAAAEAVLADADASRADLNQAMKNLVKAIGGLEYGVQKLHLETAIQTAEAILADGKTYEDIDTLAKAVEDAKKVLANENASQETVDNAAYAVLDELFKMAESEEITDLSLLENLIKAAKGLLGGSFTSDSLKNLQDAIDAAEAVVADPDRSDSDISGAYGNLIDAIINLKMEANKAALKAMLAKANEVLANASAYVAESIEGLEAIAAEAQKVYDAADAAQDAVDQAVKDLTMKVAEARLLGDVNRDGKVNTADSVEVLRSAAELDVLSAEDAASADVNRDGAVDTGDAALILQYAAEKIASF